MDSIDHQLHKWAAALPNFHPMLIGDFNLQLQRDSAKLEPILREVWEWAKLSWFRLGTSAVSRPCSETTPDHALVPARQQERWSAAVGSASLFHDFSDHLPVLTTFVIQGPMLLRKPVVSRRPRPDLDLHREEDCIKFSERLEAWVQDQNFSMDTPPTAEAASEALRLLSEESAETNWLIQKPRVLLARRMAKKRFDFWTPSLALLQARSRLLHKARKDVKRFYREYFMHKRSASLPPMATPEPGGAPLRSLLTARLDQFVKAIAKLTDIDDCLGVVARDCPFVPSELATLHPDEAILEIDLGRRALARLLLKSNRKLLRVRINDAVSKREQDYKDRKFKRIIHSVTGSKGSQVDLSCLRNDKGQLVSDPAAIHQILRDHFNRWFNPTVDRPFGQFQVDLNDRDAHFADFMSKVVQAGIPTRYGHLIWDSIHSTSVRDPGEESVRQRVARQLGDAMSTKKNTVRRNKF
jgi:hypothetical protein